MEKYFCTPHERGVLFKSQAKVAQLVERNLAKVKVAGSRPVFRSKSRSLRDFFFEVLKWLIL